MENQFRNGVVMGVSYIVGVAIPIIPYFFAPLGMAITWSIGVPLAALFILGVASGRDSGRTWWRAGVEMLGLAAMAAIILFVIPPSLFAIGAFTMLDTYRRAARRGDDETRCRRCGQILRGLTEPRCPECGERI